MKTYKLHYLSTAFYSKYDMVHFPEIEQKPHRPYIVLLVQLRNNTFALPLRTNVKHNNCYKFKHSSRATCSTTAIDFSKAIVIADSKYIGPNASIDNKEYIELNSRISFIIKKFTTYINGYYAYVAGLSNVYQAKRYKYTTLKYFHKELGIP